MVMHDPAVPCCRLRAFPLRDLQQVQLVRGFSRLGFGVLRPRGARIREARETAKALRPDSGFFLLKNGQAESSAALSRTFVHPLLSVPVSVSQKESGYESRRTLSRGRIESKSKRHAAGTGPTGDKWRCTGRQQFAEPSPVLAGDRHGTASGGRYIGL
ncbi:hypothetical protein THAOC_30377, partial [Thalassiosira oceanica]